MRERVLAERGTGPTAGRRRPLAAWDFTREPDDLRRRAARQAAGGGRSRHDGARRSTARRLRAPRRSTADLHEQDARSVGAARRPRPARRRRHQRADARRQPSSTRSSSASSEPGRWMAGSDGFRRTRVVRRPARSRGDASRSTSPSSTTPTARSPATATASPTASRTERRGRSAFEAGKAVVVFGCGTSRPAATGCWPAPSSRPGLRPGLAADEVAAVARARRVVGRASSSPQLDAAAGARGATTLLDGADRLRRLDVRRGRDSPAKLYAVTPASPGRRASCTRGDVDRAGRRRRRRRRSPARPRRADCRSDRRRPRGRAPPRRWPSGSRDPRTRCSPASIVNRLWHYHFGTRHRRDAQRLRLQRRPAQPSRAARLAGRRADRRGVTA